MRTIKKMVSLGLLVGGLWTVSGALAADLPDLGEPSVQTTTHTTAAEALSKDAVCTKCHDASEVKPSAVNLPDQAWRQR